MRVYKSLHAIESSPSRSSGSCNCSASSRLKGSGGSAPSSRGSGLPLRVKKKSILNAYDGS